MTDEPKLNFDGKEYLISSLSEQARAHVQMIQVTEAEIQRLQSLLAIAQTAHTAYISGLKSALPQ